MSAQWECLAIKRLGDDVSGNFAVNAGSMPDVNPFGGFAQFSENFVRFNGDQVSADANWVPNDSTIGRVNVTNDDLDFNATIDGTNNAIAYDLWSQGIFPGTTWTLRFKINFTAGATKGPSGPDIFVGLSDTDQSIPNTTASQSSIGWTYLFNALLVQWNSSANFGAIGLGGGFNPNPAIIETLPETTDIYFEVRRTSLTNIRVRRFTDANFTDSLQSSNQTAISGSIVNLRYIKIINRTSGVAGGSMPVVIDDVQFFNDSEGVTDSFVLHGDEDFAPVVDFDPGTATKIISGFDDGNWSVGGGPSVSGGVVSGWGADSTWKRATYDLVGNDGITMDNANWTIDFEFLRSDNDANPSHSPFMIINGTYNDDPTNNFGVVHNGVAVHYGLAGNPAVNGHQVDLQWKETVSGDFGTPGLRQRGTAQPISPIAQNVTYYFRLMRINTSRIVLEVYTDPTRTALFGQQTIDGIPSSMQDLDWINSSTNTTGGAGRILNGTVANITIYNGVAGQFQGGNVLNEDFSTYGEPVNPDFVDLFNSATGWTTTDSTRVRVEPDLGYLFYMATRDSTNDQIAFDLGATVNPSGGVIFTDDFSYASQGLADASWPSTNVAILDPFPNELSWFITGAVEDAIRHDLGVSLNGNFRIRAKIDLQNISAVSGLGKGFYWGISDITGIRTIAQDFIGLAFFVDSDVADQKIRLQWTNGQIPGTNQVDIRTSTDVQIYYVEILRTSSTAITVNIYSDAGYTSLTDTASAVMTAGVTGLRYLKAFAGSSAGGGNTMDGVLDDIEVVDNSELLSDDWLLQFKLSFTDVGLVGGAPEYLFVGIGDKDQTAGTGDDGTIQDYLGAWFRSFTPSGQRIKSVWADDEFVDNLNTGNNISYNFDQGESLWVQIIRNQQDLTLRLYDDPNFSNLIEEVTETFTGVTNLKYLKVSNLQDVAPSAGTLDATIDDICFWNNRITSCDPVPVTPTFFDDFSTYTTQIEADTAWVPQVANQQVNIVTDVLDFVTRRDGVDNRCVHDLGSGNVSNTQWTLRFKYHVDPQVLTTIVGSATLVQIQDTDVAQNSQNDMIGFGLQNNVLVAGNRWLLIGKNSGLTSGLDASPDNSVPLTEADYYLEVVRLDSINVRGRIFNNADFTDLIEELNIVTSSANIDLRYLTISSASDVTAWNGTLTGFIDDVQFFNNLATGAPGSSLTPWVSTFPADMFVDICQENLNYHYSSIVGPAGNRSIGFDLGEPLSDTKWVLRFKMFVQEIVEDVNGPCFWIGLSDEDQGIGANVSQNHIGFGITQASGAHIYGGNNGTGNIFVCSTTEPFNIPRVFTDGEIVYWEVIRESVTTLRITEFSDENYTFPVRSDSAVMSTGGAGANLINLRYLKLINRALSTLPLTNTGKFIIDDVKLWDGVDVADSFDARRYLQLLTHDVKTLAPADHSQAVRFNLDDTTSYARRRSFNGGADLGSITLDLLQWFVFSATPERFGEWDIYNKQTEEKLVQGHLIENGLSNGAGIVPTRLEVADKWANRVTKISRFNLFDETGLGGLFDLDTEAVVFGSE